MVRVIRSPMATQEIIEAVAETGQVWGQDQARKYRELIETSIKAIARHPRIGRSYNDVARGIRGYHLRKPARHIIFYRIASKNTVEIGRFIHESMDFDRELRLYIRVAQL
jgi:toxin ParE1/3/4